MRRLALIVGGLVLFVALFFASFIVVGETGEVVVLHSSDDAGEVHETRLWVVDSGGAFWLRSGSSARGWAERVAKRPAVEVERSGQRRHYAASAVPTAEARELIDRLMREKYGLADWWATLLRPDEPLPFRLDVDERARQSNPVGVR